jgi:ABC-2 type transport system permease protein
MTKVWLVARREFVAAVFNRGFLVGLLMMPALLALFAILGPRLFIPRPVHVVGDVLVLDQSHAVAAEVRRALDPKTLAERRNQMTERALAGAPAVARGAGAGQIVNAALGADAVFRVVDASDSGGDPLAAGRTWVQQDEPQNRHLAFIVIHADVLTPDSAGRPQYDMFVPAASDNRVENAIHEGIRDAIVTVRTTTAKIDRPAIEALLRVDRAPASTVTKSSDQPRAAALNILLPVALAAFMLIGVMVGGQTLLMSTVEEKSSRVIEVLLSAVSPLELMAGKILGQLAVSLLVLTVYIGLGVALLIAFAAFGLLDPMLVVYLLAFFLISYTFFGAVFATAGAAVNDVKEAQTLMGPIMLMLMGPWMAAFSIIRDPDSPMAVALSFVPPINSFVMMLRLASSTPPPLWQVGLSMAVGIAAAAGAIWFASKVFRIALLMHGKPPNLATLIRWVRTA